MFINISFKYEDEKKGIGIYYFDTKLKDWVYFLLTILVANSINFTLLATFFEVNINYYEILGNIVFTFLLYYIFAYFFDIYHKIISRIKS